LRPSSENDFLEDYHSNRAYLAKMLDREFQKKAASDPLLREHYWKQLMDARLLFVKRRYDHEFKWKPGRKMEEAIVAAILNSAQGHV
jgi:hypothetical protein